VLVRKKPVNENSGSQSWFHNAFCRLPSLRHKTDIANFFVLKMHAFSQLDESNLR